MKKLLAFVVLMFLLAPNFVMAQMSLGSGLIAYWPLDRRDYQGFAALSPIHSRVGDFPLIRNNNPTNALGKVGNSVRFSGTSAYLIYNSDSSILEPSDITISVWIYPTNLTSNRGILSKRALSTSNSYALFYFTTTNDLTFDWGISSGTGNRWSTGYLPPLNSWTHIVVTRNNTSRNLYVNGIFSTSTPDVDGDINSTGGLTIGALNGSPPASMWEGNIDDVRIYDRALTASEIYTLYRSQAFAARGSF